jgi:hypothetical protein
LGGIGDGPLPDVDDMTTVGSWGGTGVRCETALSPKEEALFRRRDFRTQKTQKSKMNATATAAAPETTTPAIWAFVRIGPEAAVIAAWATAADVDDGRLLADGTGNDLLGATRMAVLEVLIVDVGKPKDGAADTVEKVEEASGVDGEPAPKLFGSSSNVVGSAMDAVSVAWVIGCAPGTVEQIS